MTLAVETQKELFRALGFERLPGDYPTLWDMGQPTEAYQLDLARMTMPDNGTGRSGDATRHRSLPAPALASFRGQRWMAYVADDSSHQLLVISSADGRNWSVDFVTHHRSPFAPTLRQSGS